MPNTKELALNNITYLEEHFSNVIRPFIEELQKEINARVLMNRQAVKLDPTFEDDYTESIESYYVNL